MGIPIVGLSCANCGQETATPEARELIYGTDIALESPNQPGERRGVATFRFAVMRPGGEIGPASALLLCDGCMGAALKAVCQSILSDMESMRVQGGPAPS